MQELPPGFRPVGTPPASDPVIAPADPYKEKSEQRADRSLAIQESNASIQSQINQMKLQEMQREQGQDEQRTDKATEAARYGLLKTIKELNNIAIDANDAGGWFETGTSGQFARGVLPGANAAKDLAGDIETLNADFAFSALNAMREASKTGGALGNVTERELDLLKASTANISPDLSHGTFLKNVEKARQAYLSKLAVIDPQMATQLGYNAEDAETALLELNEEYERQFGDPNAPAPTVNREFITEPKPNRTPEDIEAIMKKYGVE